MKKNQRSKDKTVEEINDSSGRNNWSWNYTLERNYGFVEELT